MVKQDKLYEQRSGCDFHSNADSSDMVQEVPRTEKVHKQERQVFLVGGVDIHTTQHRQLLFYLSPDTINCPELPNQHDGFHEVQTNRRRHYNEPRTPIRRVLNVSNIYIADFHRRITH